MNIKFTKFIQTLKELRLNYLTTTKIMFFLEKTSLVVMAISTILLVCLFTCPEFWEIKLY